MIQSNNVIPSKLVPWLASQGNNIAWNDTRYEHSISVIQSVALEIPGVTCDAEADSRRLEHEPSALVNASKTPSVSLEFSEMAISLWIYHMRMAHAVAHEEAPAAVGLCHIGGRSRPPPTPLTMRQGLPRSSAEFVFTQRC